MVFFRAAGAGLVALGLNFILRFGMIAPFPPESAIESFLRIIPESIQEPAVQQLGDLAGDLGLIVVSIVVLVLYGILGVVFLRIVLPRLAKIRSLSFLEGFLSYSLVPWIIFGFILLPIFGVSFFGTTSVFATSNATWLFPLSLLFVQLVYSFVMYYEFEQAGIIPQSTLLISESLLPLNTAPEIVKSAERRKQSRAETTAISRRAFVEKGVLAVGSLALVVTSLDVILSAIVASSGSAPAALSSSGTPVNLQDAPAIFSDPRLASLADAEVTSNDVFYRVAIDLFDPAVDASSYALKVGGLVKQPKNYDLTGFENFFSPVSQYNTFECVSNTINGNLIGNAKWTGVKISDLLQDVGGVSPNATYVVFSSVDGYSVGVPLSKAMMSDSILAYKMNDQTLPQKHGFPIRAVIPGLYGMMSAKWINMIEVVDSTYVGYWQTRGWSNDATVQTVAFINIPSDGSSVSLSKNNGSILLGGVAYAGDRGISKIEVSTDQGNTWQTVQLKKSLSNDSWTLWAYEWTPEEGNYSIYARATDGSGALQTSMETDTFPSGATGYAMIAADVTS
jgi:DMSO/TMAO reductase YedYZ molybdopterin-dependent catalytic subunit